MSEPVPSEVPRAPIRKRRRPALSCEQCRRRKIKCDRRYPCGQCLQSKTQICSFTPGPRTARTSATHVAGRESNPLGSLLQDNNGLPSRGRSSIPSPPETHTTDGTSPTLPDGSMPWQSPRQQRVLRKNSRPEDRVYHDGFTEAASRKNLEKRFGGILGTEDTFDEPESHTDLHDRIRYKHLDHQDGQLDADGNRLTTLGKNHEAYETKGKLRGTVSKTRFFGQTHWMYSFGTFDKIACLAVNPSNHTPEFRGEDAKLPKFNGLDSTGFNRDSALAQGSQVSAMLEECKALARAAKAKPHNDWLKNPDFRQAVPSRDMCDKLVALYFRTNECRYRILHTPTFQREYLQYWETPDGASSIFVMKMLLVMSVGSSFYQEADSRHWHDQALQWVYAGQAWLASPFEKGRLHISGLQIHCLVLIARLANAVAGDLVWISVGALLRTAYQMGFHRDPKYLPRIPPLNQELRRRLWATIIELNVQAALDSGMQPMLSFDDFDTEAPANLNDEDLDEATNTLPTPKPPSVLTQTSLQIRLFNTLRVRMTVVQRANNFRADPTYEEVLALDSQLTAALKDTHIFINRTRRDPQPGGLRVTQLQRNLIDISIRRFLLAVHRPYAAKAQKDPRYYFSRKVCLDCSMNLLTLPSSDLADPSSTPSNLPEGHQDDYTRMKTVSGGFFKGLIIHAAMIVFAELFVQLEEDSSFGEVDREAREPLKKALREIVELSEQRVKAVENNIKGHLFTSVVLAQVEAMEHNLPADQAVLEAATNSCRLCLEHLKRRIPSGGLSKKDYSRHVDSGSILPDETGDGVDDVVGGGLPLGPGGFGMMGAYGDQVGMQDWNMDWAGAAPDQNWLLGGWEDNTPWGLQV